MQFMKKKQSLLNIADMNLEVRFHKRQVSFLVVKIVKGTFKYHTTVFRPLYDGILTLSANPFPPI